MFKEPLENTAHPNSLTGQLATLCDAYHEFHCFCAFIQHVSSLMANEPMELDEEIAEGLRIGGRAVRERSEAIKERLTVLHEMAKEVRHVD